MKKWIPVTSWCLYDFANSAFVTLVTTFIYGPYFTSVIAPENGTTYWSYGATVTAILVALSAPFLGAVADRGGYRKRYLIITTVTNIVFTSLLYFIMPGQIFMAVAFYTVANIMMEMSSVFYNAYLPEIAPANRIGRISGYGWALGYIGGLLAMVVALFAFIYPDQPWFGITKENDQHIRATTLLVAVWFAVFSLPMFLFVHEKRVTPTAPVDRIFQASWNQLKNSFQEIRRFRHTVRFLAGRLLYNDALTTTYAFAGIYAVSTFDFSMQEIMVLGIVLNVTAGLGSFLLGFLDDYLGGKKTIQISLLGLILAGFIGVFAPDKTWFWIAGILVGIFGGPNQSASRSLMGRFTPADKENEFFGFFAFSGKATAFLGPFLLGQLTYWTASARIGFSVVIVFFILGAIILHFVNEEEGMKAARNHTAEHAGMPLAEG